MKPTVLTYDVESWGVGELVLIGERPVYHELPWPARRRAARHLSTADADPEASDAGERLCARIGSFFNGRPVVFDAGELRLDESLEEWGLSPFSRALARQLWHVDWGERLTYGELAERAGRVRAARAAGTFCASNRLSLLIPCHRVVASSGVGSYGSYGSDYKARLLALERR